MPLLTSFSSFPLAVSYLISYIMCMAKPIPHTRDYIEAAFMSAATLDELSETLGCSNSTCYNYAHRYSIALPPARPRGGRRRGTASDQLGKLPHGYRH